MYICNIFPLSLLTPRKDRDCKTASSMPGEALDCCGGFMGLEFRVWGLGDRDLKQHSPYFEALFLPEILASGLLL